MDSGNNADNLESVCSGLRLEFRPSLSDNGTLSRDEIARLDRLPWEKGATLSLFGCNSGVARDGWAVAGAFARAQSVTTIGQSGFSYISASPSEYVAPKPGDKNIYLLPFAMHKNSDWLSKVWQKITEEYFGAVPKGRRMPGVVFQP